MPGIFGGVGYQREDFTALKNKFCLIWKNCESISLPWGCLGGHGLGEKPALHAVGEHYYFAINGEATSYSIFVKKTKEFNSFGPAELLSFAAVCKGSIAMLDGHSRTCHIAAEHTGTFPLYYASKNGHLIFSSHIKPLATVLQAPSDPIGIVEFLIRRHTFYRRTHFQNIFRLLPGQIISFCLDSGKIIIREPQIDWLNQESFDSINTIPSEVLWDTLNQAIKSCFNSDSRHALMMSGGWDSRFLLCAMLDHLESNNICAYSFGNPRSRELELVRKICHLVGIQCIQEPLDERLYAPEYLQKIFEQIEHTLFPHWHQAAQTLAKTGVTNVTAGVYGEILGGHYGPAMFQRGIRKASTVGRELLGFPVNCNPLEILRFPRIIKGPSYLTESFWGALLDISSEINADIECSLRYLLKHDLKGPEQIIEAFTALNRGSTFINQQLLSCRTTLDVTLPFTDLNFLKLSSQIPFKWKIHNSMHHRLLKNYGYPLLQFPTAATLVAASLPISIQETSRIIRKLRDKIHKELGNNLFDYPQQYPSDFWGLEFLQNGKAFTKLLEDLRCDIWNRNALHQSIAKAAQHKQHNMLSLSYDFLKIYMTDLLLR